MTCGNSTGRRRRAAIAGLAGLICAITAGSLLSKPSAAPGDDTMTTALPVAFHRTESLEDVAAIATGDSGYLVTVEHTRELAAPALTVPSERTIWRFRSEEHTSE